MPPIGASRIASNFITAPDVIPDSVEYQFVASSGTDGGDWTSEDGSVTMPAGGSPTHQSGPNGETVYYYDGAGDSHGPATITTISQPTAIVGVLRYAPTGQNNARALGATDNDDPYHFTAPDGPNDGYTMYAGSYIGA